MTALFRFGTLAFAAAVAVPALAWAQAVGQPVPAYEQPKAPPPPARTGETVVQEGVKKADRFATQEDLVAGFADAYRNVDKPRLAFYWNRQLSATLDQWYGEARIIGSAKATNDVVGDHPYRQGVTAQSTTEIQRRKADENRRLQPSEGWEWEFQDGFLAPFLEARAIVLDRAAIMRLTAVGTKESDEQTVETRALLGMADLLVEVLVAPAGKSTTGYELRARILDIKTGAIMGIVNSRGLEEWQRQEKATATSRGFVMADDLDDDSFGPEKGQGYTATSRGFEQKRKPPKLRLISQNLAYNVMKAMMKAWE